MMSEHRALKIAILWHMHQPNYREPHTRRLAMPWVRLHALKDYLDMPLMATRYENVKVTFNLVPSLIDQLNVYLEGGTDRHLELSRIPAAELSREQKTEILQTFFMANPERMIEPFPRFAELYHKQLAIEQPSGLVDLFSSGEFRDLQVWSNLVWVDPMFRREQPVRDLFAKGRHFDEADKAALLDWQLNLMGRIVSTYQKLQREANIEVSFTPYYHPILPLLCDTDIAREALPTVTLPQTRFAHPEDARWHIERSQDQYVELFGEAQCGMWPSEGSVSEEVLNLAAQCGLKWLASDEEVLTHALSKSGLNVREHPIHRVYRHSSGVRMLFRDHALSDRIGFVYSTWEPARAVADFMSHLKNLRSIYRDQLDRVVVPIILDGENAWEYFPDDGADFLDLFYRTLAEDRDFETVTFNEATTSLEPLELPTMFAGSWINHNFRIWIGHSEDNAAWDLLSKTRRDLVAYAEKNPAVSRETLQEAWRQIYIAEGSDWCWWYGEEHRSAQNEDFDRIFRHHLIAVYEILGVPVPDEHYRPIFVGGPDPRIIMPDGLVTPTIDGRLTHFYEWAGSGSYDCMRNGGAMHAVDRVISQICFAYDRERFYIRLDFNSLKFIESREGLHVNLELSTSEPRRFDLPLHKVKAEGDGYNFACGDRLEFAVDRDALWPRGHGVLTLLARLEQDGQQVEIWPEHEPLRVEVPRRFEEMFWPS